MKTEEEGLLSFKDSSEPEEFIPRRLNSTPIDAVPGCSSCDSIGDIPG